MDYLIYNLAEAALHAQADASLLSQEERATAEKRGPRYLLTRCLLRRELARRLDTHPQDIRLRYGEHGKPECEGIEFNLSHSGDCLAIAFDAFPIGIDVELVRPRPRLNALAARIMSPEQYADFCARGCPAEEFYACWCAAEALVKQAGESVWQARTHPFRYEHGRIRLLTEDASAIRLFSPAPGYRGAVAYRLPAEG